VANCRGGKTGIGGFLNNLVFISCRPAYNGMAKSAVCKFGFMTTETKNFREVCCHKLGIPAEAFEKTVLMASLPPLHLLVGHLRWHFTKSYFDSDLELIRLTANCTTTKEIRTEINYHRYNDPAKGFHRKFLGARMSGQRLINFASQFIPSK